MIIILYVSRLLARFVASKCKLTSTATSSRDDIHRRIGGHCSTENTKVIFKVFGGDESSHKMAVTDVPTGHDKSPPHHHHHNNNFDWKDEDSSESTNSEAEDANKIHFSSGDYDHATHVHSSSIATMLTILAAASQQRRLVSSAKCQEFFN